MTVALYCVASALLHSVWQGVVIAAGLAAARAITRDPRARYLQAGLALGAMALSPLVTMFVAASTLPAASGHLRGGAAHPPALATALVLSWAIGALFMCARLAGSLVYVRHVVTREAEPLSAEWQTRLRTLADRLGVTRVVRLVESKRITAPAVLGWLRPIILVPASAIADLPPSMLEAILAHELAHIRRHDYLVNAVQSAVCAVLFYHPCAWWISRCLEDERESCCDDIVVDLTGDALTYARALTTLESSRTHDVPLGIAATGGSLMTRIRRLVEDKPASGAPRLAVVIALAACVLSAGALPILACASSASPQSETQGQQASAVKSATSIAIAWLPAPVKQWAPELVAAATRYGVDPEMLAIVTMVESNGDANALSPSGAVGLMQLMPATAQKIATERGLADFSLEKLKDPSYNLDFGAFFLAEQIRAFGRDRVDLVAAAYNGGPDRVRAFVANGAPLSEETAQYEKTVTALWARRHDATATP